MNTTTTAPEIGRTTLDVDAEIVRPDDVPEKVWGHFLGALWTNRALGTTGAKMTTEHDGRTWSFTAVRDGSHYAVQWTATTPAAPAPVRINLVPESAYRRDTYGVLLTSDTQHAVTGRGVHNPHHPHMVDVWENRPAKYNGAPIDPATGQPIIVDPSNEPTTERYTYLLAPRAVVISAYPTGDEVREGASIALGQEIELAVHGYVIGTFRVEARPFHNPHLTRVS